MKKLNSMGAALLVAAMIATPVLPAMAADGGDGSITIRAAENQSLEGKTFTAYHLFDLTYVNTGIEDTDATDDYAYDLVDAYETFFTNATTIGGLGLSVSVGETVDSVAYNYIASLTPEELNLFAKAAYDWSISHNISGVTGTMSANKKSYLIDNLADGYWLVYETVTEAGGTLSRGILSTVVAEVDSKEATETGVKDVVVVQKADIPTLDKEIYHNELGTWGEVGDNSIGDTVYYRIHTTIPDTFGYQSYQYIIHDQMEAGLTFNVSSVKMYTDADKQNEVTSGWNLVQSINDSCTFEVNVSRAKLDELYTAGKRDLYVYFDCVLNEKAEIAGEHNDNTAHLEYSNNPYVDTTTTGQPDTVYDYTFTLNATKVNADGAALKNAEFQIMKNGTVIQLLKDSNNVYYVKGTIKNAVGMTETDTIVTEAGGKIIIKGLDDAVEYTLRETKAPAGYVKADDIVFTLTATYDDATNLLDKVTTNNQDLKIVSHAVTDTILDKAQPPLPVTGGTGTTIFYVVSALTAIAAVICISYAKKKNTTNVTEK